MNKNIFAMVICATSLLLVKPAFSNQDSPGFILGTWEGTKVVEVGEEVPSNNVKKLTPMEKIKERASKGIPVNEIPAVKVEDKISLSFDEDKILVISMKEFLNGQPAYEGSSIKGSLEKLGIEIEEAKTKKHFRVENWNEKIFTLIVSESKDFDEPSKEVFKMINDESFVGPSGMVFVKVK